MAKKKKSKKKENATKEIALELTQLASENDKYVGDLARFLEEKIEDIKIAREGNRLTLTVDEKISRRKIRDYLKKFLYLARLEDVYRPIALQESEKGYEIHSRPEFE